MRRALKKNETMKLGKVFLGSSPWPLKEISPKLAKTGDILCARPHFFPLFLLFFPLPAHKMVSNVAPCKILGL